MSSLHKKRKEREGGGALVSYCSLADGRSFAKIEF